ncbi:hypothetical protein CBS101457_000295 [Exobasidium rhododendri]|nr:hypothetical protein CBS101457_000295 [Exobasidium rhododendri]
MKPLSSVAAFLVLVCLMGLSRASPLPAPAPAPSPAPAPMDNNWNNFEHQLNLGTVRTRTSSKSRASGDASDAKTSRLSKKKTYEDLATQYGSHTSRPSVRPSREHTPMQFPAQYSPHWGLGAGNTVDPVQEYQGQQYHFGDGTSSGFQPFLGSDSSLHFDPHQSSQVQAVQNTSQVGGGSSSSSYHTGLTWQDNWMGEEELPSFDRTAQYSAHTLPQQMQDWSSYAAHPGADPSLSCSYHPSDPSRHTQQEPNFIYTPPAFAQYDEGEQQAGSGSDLGEDTSGISPVWRGLGVPGQEDIVDTIYAYTGYSKETIKGKCRHLLSSAILEACRSGKEEYMDLAMMALFTQYSKPQIKQRWTRDFAPEQVDAVIDKMAAAAGRRRTFIINSFARMFLSPNQAYRIWQSSPEECALLAEELSLTEKSDRIRAEIVRATKMAKNAEKLAWMSETESTESPEIVKKLMPYVGRSAKWCYAKLRLSNVPGLGERIRTADDQDMRVIAAYLISLKVGKPNSLSPRRY